MTDHPVQDSASAATSGRSRTSAQATTEALAGPLALAIKDRQLTVEFQPIVDLRTGGLVTGFEVLARWARADGSQVPPDLFIRAAEQHGLIEALTEQILDRACASAATWLHDGLAVHLSINISPQLVADGSATTLVLDAVRRHELRASQLTVEVTESGVDVDVGSTSLELNRLHAAGIRCSLDNFGSGQSSLDKLRSYPLSALKIGRSFVSGVSTTPSDFDIVESIAHLGKRLGLTVIAVGVDSEANYTTVQRAGCDLAQGSYLSEPLAMFEVPGMVGVVLPR